MEGIGEKFQKARMARNLTLEEAARMTKIRPNKLAEIEAEDFSHFPSLAYAKGFLLIYGKFLNVDVSPYLEAFETSETMTVDGYSYLQDNPVPKPRRVEVIPRRPAANKSSLMPLLIGLLVLFVGFWLLRLIMDVRRIKPSERDAQALALATPSPAATSTIIAPRALPVDSTPAPKAIAIAPTPTATPQPTAIALATPESEEPEVRRAEPVHASDLAKAQLALASPSPSASPAPAGNRFDIRPLRKTFVKVTVDGEDGRSSFERWMDVKGAPVQVRGKKIVVKVLDPADLEIRKNGKVIARGDSDVDAWNSKLVRVTLPVRPNESGHKPTVGMISLGCAKNLVDAEIMLGSVRQHGMEITARADEADVLVINTCAFIDSAKEESIDAILDAHQQRGLTSRPGQKLIVSGCMSQRFSKELREQLPEVDAFIGLDQVRELGAIVERVLREPATGVDLVTARPTYIPNYDTPRFRLTPSHSAYLKIAEGCNHPCSFCVIPQMRGRHRSRPMGSILSEVRSLVAEGVKEINLISQDTTYYGMDLWAEKAGPRQQVDSARGTTLSMLLREIQNVPGDFWVRLLYTHPAHWSGELIQTIAECDKVARYIDMPLQHIDEAMLLRMRRETGREHIEELVRQLRAGIPGVALRTTFIVGFPGETEAEFETLLDFIERARFERLGIFKYSQEEGSRAAKMPEQIPPRTKNARYRRAMLVQQRIAREIAQERVGRELKLLVDQPLIARSEADAPDVDATVILAQAAPVGEFIHRRITGSRGYDLLA